MCLMPLRLAASAFSRTEICAVSNNLVVGRGHVAPMGGLVSLTNTWK